MVPGGRYFRICVASASADTASFPLPHGRGGDGLPAPKEPGIRAAEASETELVGSVPENISGKPTPPLPIRSLRQRAFRSRCLPFPSSPPHPQPAPAPPVPSQPPVRTTRAGHLPSHAASHPSPKRKGPASRSHTQRRQPARTMSLSAAAPPTPGHTHRTVASSRGARREDPLPTTTPTALPGPRTHLQLTAAAGTSRGGQRVSRRGPAAADSSLSPPPPFDKPQASEAGEPRARSPYNHLFPGSRRCGERQATRNTDVPPPLPPPPLIVLPLPKGLGNPPAQLQPITHLLREQDPTFSRPSAEHAQNAAALTYSRARKAGEPEPA